MISASIDNSFRARYDFKRVSHIQLNPYPLPPIYTWQKKRGIEKTAVLGVTYNLRKSLFGRQYWGGGEAVNGGVVLGGGGGAGLLYFQSISK